MKYYVYIIQWETNHYIWYTSDLENRFKQHQNWEVQTTSKMWKLNLLWYFVKDNKTEALKLERMIKRNGHIQYWISHPTFVKYD